MFLYCQRVYGTQESVDETMPCAINGGKPLPVTVPDSARQYQSVSLCSIESPGYHPARTLCRLALLALISIIAACASGPLVDLDRGKCPSPIIYPGERSEEGRQRYGESVTNAQLAGYRDRELANCRQQLSSGEPHALTALLGYWYAQENMQEVASTYRTYVETGSDQRELAQASGNLYELYTEGKPGLPADPDAAFHYLGLARDYDPATYALPYADAQYHRGLYADAWSQYDDMLAKPTDDAFLTRSQRCEINLKMADLYFRGRGVKENWNIGYYYWLEGLSTARDASWGSCDKQTYYDHERYAYESGRRKELERRVKAMGKTQAGRVKDAWGSPEQGLAYIAAMDFRRPMYRETVPESKPRTRPAPRRTVAAAPTPSYGKWPSWRPVGGDFCQWHTSYQPHRWSDVFQLRSGAIWSVKSSAGGAQSMGSAVAISRDTLLTNCHVIHDPAGVSLLKVGRSLQAKVVAADREGDRCILRASGQLPTYVTPARSQRDLLVGEDVAAIGNPKGLETSLSRGLVAQKRNRSGLALIQTDAAISSGSSGGGLFDTSGNLIGITTFKVSTGESLNFAIAIDEFCR